MKLTVTAFVSLDGVMQGPGGPTEDTSNGFDLGGWLVPYADDEFGQVVVDWFDDADAFLLGRHTYQIFASHWPKVTDPDDPVATKLNTLPKYVVSSGSPDLQWTNSHLITGDIRPKLQELKDRPGRALQVHGSAGLIQTLLRHNVVDEIRLFTFPLTLGRGKRLFEPGISPAAWRQSSVANAANGVTTQVLTYAGEPTFGNIVIDEGEEQVE